jgi:low temperature requirement protein LtrA
MIIPISFLAFSFIGRDDYPFGMAYGTASGAIVLVFILLALILPFPSAGQAAACLIAALFLLLIFTWVFQTIVMNDTNASWMDLFFDFYFVLALIAMQVVHSVSEFKSH